LIRITRGGMGPRRSAKTEQAQQGRGARLACADRISSGARQAVGEKRCPGAGAGGGTSRIRGPSAKHDRGGVVRHGGGVGGKAGPSEFAQDCRDPRPRPDRKPPEIKRQRDAQSQRGRSASGRERRGSGMTVAMSSEPVPPWPLARKLPFRARRRVRGPRLGVRRHSRIPNRLHTSACVAVGAYRTRLFFFLERSLPRDPGG